jgi:hypothetical protein
MLIRKIEITDKIEKGTLLLVQGSATPTVAAYRVHSIVTVADKAKEVILHRRTNTYFNIDMYFEGKSWAKDVRIVLP